MCIQELEVKNCPWKLWITIHYGELRFNGGVCSTGQASITPLFHKVFKLCLKLFIIALILLM